MSKRDRILLLEDMLDSALKIKHYTNEFEKYYLCDGKQSDGNKSTTELKTQYPEIFSALRAEDNNPSGSNILLELKTQEGYK